MFYNPNLGNLSFEEMINEIIKYMLGDPRNFYEVTVGCDSSSDYEPNFLVVVTILKRGHGGRFFIKKINYPNKKFYHLHERIIQEVLISCQVALDLRGQLQKKIRDKQINPNYEFCYIHADVGENGPTKDMIKEIIGLIRGNGFKAKIKPESYTASNVADKYT